MIKRLFRHLFQSLSGRLILASVILLPMILAVTATALDRAFAQSQQVAETERLRTQIYLLLGAAEIIGEEIWLPDQLQEPRFNQPESGLYARVLEGSNTVWQSPSAMMAELPNPLGPPLTAGQEQFSEILINSNLAHTLSFDVVWDTELGFEKTYRFEVYHDQAPLLAEKKSYRRQLQQWLGLMAIALVVVLWLIQKWGLQPLSALAQDLKRVETGESLCLDTDYPSEIQPVITNLNRVLETERAQRDRYRNTLSDLAHSLKTPLAVIRGSLNQDISSNVINEQVSRMDEIVRHQLQRAATQTTPMMGNKGQPVAEACERLASALGKVYREKNVNFDFNIGKQCLFHGDASDLLELLGNLLDNACKYGGGKVKVSGQVNKKMLVITIEDNGPGVTDKHRGTILKRGARADTVESGQGIGLAVVVDIVSSYNGSLDINDSALGGAAFVIELPVAQA